MPVTRLINDNGLMNANDLVVGQAIVIVYPEQIYVVQSGDSLISIAKAHNVTVMQLLRNNPFLSDSEYLYPGETIVISYRNNKKTSINGYAYPFIAQDTLKKTLPFLTYLTIFNYRSIENGDIIGVDDSEIINMAYKYGVAPIMSLSTLSYQGVGNIEVVNKILDSEELQAKHIDNILTILRTKNYYGLNISIVHLNQENRLLYENYISKLYNRLNNEGFLLFVTITPRTLISSNEITFEKVDYTNLGQSADNILLLSYGWGYSVRPPSASTPAYVVNNILDYSVSLIPPEKIYIGISTIGYDWPLPYILGITRANSLTTNAAITLASEANATIQFDEASQSPYYQYSDYNSEIPTQHIVWFKDGRSIDALVQFVPEYGIQGVSIWNIMNYFAQMWFVINTQYVIEKVLPEPLL